MIRPVYLWKKAQVSLHMRRRKLINLAWIQGVLLLACVVIAMLLANLPLPVTCISIFWRPA